MVKDGRKYQPSLGCAMQSSVTSLAAGDVLELFLDCDNGKLMIYKRGSGEFDSLEGFKGEMYPLFNFTQYSTNECLTLLL